MEDKFEYVKHALDGRRGKWTEIARKAHVCRRTISLIMNAGHLPTMTTIERLYKHLKKLERKV